MQRGLAGDIMMLNVSAALHHSMWGALHIVLLSLEWHTEDKCAAHAGRSCGAHHH